MNSLTGIITATDPAMRNRSLDAFCARRNAGRTAGGMRRAGALPPLQRQPLRARARAVLPLRHPSLPPSAANRGSSARAAIPFAGYANLLKRRFEEAIEIFLAAQAADGAERAISSALAAAYRGLGFQTLADQVRRSVRSVRGNQWMFRTGHPADYPLRVRPELLERGADGLFPILREATPVRMDLTHSGWSDIFFLGMDFPEGARVLNVSIDLSVWSAGRTARLHGRRWKRISGSSTSPCCGWPAWICRPRPRSPHSPRCSISRATIWAC